MNQHIQIIRVHREKDADGIAQPRDEILACVRAYHEQRYGNIRWANRAAFSEATSLFRLRVMPGVAVEPLLIIVCRKKRYEVLSVEEIRGQYLEILTKRIDSVGTHDHKNA
jgi:hypothetical protein